MLNRKLIPPNVKIDKVDFKKATSLKVKEGVNLHYFNHEGQKVIRAKFQFDAGVSKQKMNLVASVTSDLLFEGCSNYSAFEIANEFDSFGAYVDTECSADSAGITLHCLSKDFEPLLILILKIINSATFPKEEFEKLISIKKQQFLVNEQKGSFVAKNEFNKFVLGDNNPYASKIELEDFDKLKNETVLNFYKKNYKGRAIEIFLAGDVNSNVLDLIKKSFEDYSIRDAGNSINIEEIIINNNEVLEINLPSAIQTAIRVGISTISKSHKDFAKLYLANVVLGGYFGSRLMNNIREDKGYTYGIGSGIINLKHSNYFVISTEVGAEFTRATLKEIEKELDLLSTELISNLELNRVKNYSIGSLLRGFDGSFAIMDRFEMLKNLGLDYSYYSNLLKDILEVTPEELRSICRQYLNFSEMKKILVGKV